MHPYIIEELARAIVQEREEEARLARPHTQQRPETRAAPRSRLARKLVQTGLHLDRAAADRCCRRSPRAVSPSARRR
jgi:hypothetical protein